MNYDKLLMRYLYGLVKHRGVDSRYWLKAFSVADPFHRMVLDELHEMWSNKSSMAPELITEKLVRAAKYRGLDESKIFAFVGNALQSDVEKVEVKELHDAIIMHYAEADTKAVLSKLIASANSPTAIDEAIDRLRSLKALQPSTPVDLGDQLAKAIDDVESGHEGLIPYGVKPLDKHLGGVPRKEIVILAGRPGHGKTSVACQFVLNILDQGFRVMVVSKEMDTSRLLHKLIANKSSLTSDVLKMGNLTAEQKLELRRASRALQDQYDGRLLVFDDVYDSHKIETLVARHRPDVVIDDFIQLSSMDDNNMRVEINRTLKHYKQMVKAYNMGIVVLSQLNRDIEKREDPRPKLSDLAESGTIEQLAAQVIFVFYGYAFDHEEYPDDIVELIIEKNRYGKRFSSRLHFDGDHMRYTAIPGRA